VQVVIIDFCGSLPTFEKIRLKSAAPGEDILDRSRLEEAAFREQRLAGYLTEVKAAGSYQRTDVRGAAGGDCGDGKTAFGCN